MIYDLRDRGTLRHLSHLGARLELVLVHGACVARARTCRVYSSTSRRLLVGYPEATLFQMRCFAIHAIHLDVIGRRNDQRVQSATRKKISSRSFTQSGVPVRNLYLYSRRKSYTHLDRSCQFPTEETRARKGNGDSARFVNETSQLSEILCSLRPSFVSRVLQKLVVSPLSKDRRQIRRRIRVTCCFRFRESHAHRFPCEQIVEDAGWSTGG